MKIEDITQLKQTYYVEEANRLMAQGYQLIKILSSKTQGADREEVRPVYILGLMKSI